MCEGLLCAVTTKALLCEKHEQVTSEKKGHLKERQLK